MQFAADAIFELCGAILIVVGILLIVALIG